MTIAMVTERLKALRRTKLYDLFAAAPLIAWYVFCAAQMLPSLVQQVALIKLFIQTDPSVLPATLVLSTVSHISTLVFFAVLVVMFAVRHVPQRAAPGFYPRCAAVAGTFLERRLRAAASARAFVCTLPGLASLDYRRHWFRNLCGACSRAFDQHPAGGSATRNWGPYALVRHPLYLGEIVALTGVALQYMSAWALLLLGLVWAFQLQRMKNEEQVLFQSFRNTETTWRGRPVWCRACTSGVR